MIPVQIAPHIFQINLGFVNAYALTVPDDSWVLVDTGLKIHEATLRSIPEHFGKPPAAIVLTHGHLDHAGSALALVKAWGVKVYAHRLERPYLQGESVYPPQDPTVGGPLALVSRLMPKPLIKLGAALELVPEAGHLEILPGWKIIDTPGHAPGHVSLWHDSDRVLVAGDALATANFDTVVGFTTKKPELARAGSPFICDWGAAHESARKLADLEPVVVAAGHGNPMQGADLPEKMREFARHFKAPEQGRYVHESAVTDETGVVSLPPKPSDPLPRNALIGAAALGVLAFAVGSRWRDSNK